MESHYLGGRVVVDQMVLLWRQWLTEDLTRCTTEKEKRNFEGNLHNIYVL